MSFESNNVWRHSNDEGSNCLPKFVHNVCIKAASGFFLKRGNSPSSADGLRLYKLAVVSLFHYILWSSLITCLLSFQNSSYRRCYQYATCKRKTIQIIWIKSPEYPLYLFELLHRIDRCRRHYYYYYHHYWNRSRFTSDGDLRRLVQPWRRLKWKFLREIVSTLRATSNVRKNPTDKSPN